MDLPQEIICPACKKFIPSSSFFCSYCGAKIQPGAEKTSLNTSVGKQIIIYSVSFLLAPFGLAYAIKYIRQPDPKARTIGIISLVLTILAIILMLWIGMASINSYNDLLKSTSGLEGIYNF